MQATVKMSRQGQITIPKEIRHLLGIDPEDYVTVDVIGRAAKIEMGNAEGVPCQ